MHTWCYCGYFALFCLCGTPEVLAADGRALGALGKQWLPFFSGLAMKPPSIAEEEEQCWSALLAKINRGTESCTRLKSWVITMWTQSSPPSYEMPAELVGKNLNVAAYTWCTEHCCFTIRNQERLQHTTTFAKCGRRLHHCIVNVPTILAPAALHVRNKCWALE